MRHRLRVVPLVLACFAGLGVVGWVMFGSAVVEAVGALDGVESTVSAHRRLWPQVRTDAYYLDLGWWTGLRYLLFCTIIFALTWRYWEVIRVRLSEFLVQPGPPRLLAAFRVLLFGSMIVYSANLNVTFFAGLPDVLISRPAGWGVLAGMWPPSPEAAKFGLFLFWGAAGAAALGIGFRYTGWTAVVLFIFVAGIPQFFGKINHYHHLVWAGAILAAAPSASAWSLDKLLGKASAVSRLDAGFTLRFVCLLIGLMYFFPGFWKVVVGGWNWFWGDELRYILYAQWVRTGDVEFAWLDDIPGLLELGGLFTPLWEIGFLFLLFGRKTRLPAIDGGIVFHLTIGLVAGINFWSMVVLYLAFLVFVRIKGSLASMELPAVPHPKSVRPMLRRTAWIVGGLVVAAGFLHVDSWPVAVYPTFAAPASPAIETVEVTGFRAGREVAHIEPFESEAIREEIGPSRILGLLMSLSIESDRSQLQEKAAALARVLADIDPRLADTDSLAITNIRKSTIPEAD